MPLIRQIAGEQVHVAFTPGQGTAGTEDDWVAFVPEQDITVTGVTWVPNAAITAHATDFFVLQLLNAGNSDGVVASRTYAATNSVAKTAEAMTLGTSAELDVDAGDVLYIHKETGGGGSGLAMPDGHVKIKYKVRG